MKLTKAQRTAHAKFVREFKSLVESTGVPRDEDALYGYSIRTNVGVYRFNVDTLLDGYCTVFGRFDEPSRAKTRVDCNPFSGKWNFHFGILNTEPEAVTAAQRSAHQILSLIEYRPVVHELCQERTPHPETQIMKLTLTIEVEYDPGTANQRELMGILHDAAFHLAGEGLLTGESDATVEHWKATVS